MTATWSEILKVLKAHQLFTEEDIEKVRRATAPLRHRERTLKALSAASYYINTKIPVTERGRDSNSFKFQLEFSMLPAARCKMRCTPARRLPYPFLFQNLKKKKTTVPTVPPCKTTRYLLAERGDDSTVPPSSPTVPPAKGTSWRRAEARPPREPPAGVAKFVCA
jgi:hypothetical protein